MFKLKEASVCLMFGTIFFGFKKLKERFVRISSFGRLAGREEGEKEKEKKGERRQTHAKMR